MSTLKTESQLLQIRVDVIPIDQISDFRNKLRNISRSLSILDVGTVSQTVRSGNGPYIGKYHAHPALLTVFSTTQLEHSITQLVFIRSQIWKCIQIYFLYVFSL